MPVTIGGGLSFCGREVKAEELDLIRQITREFSRLSLTELAHTLCELLEWRRPNGGLKSRECYLFLLALHGRGWLPWLSPPPRKQRPRAPVWDQHSDAQPPLTGSIGDYFPLQLQLLTSSDDRRLFRQYIQRYHYLGYKVPYGAQLRYFVRSPQSPGAVLACLLFTSAAWKMAPRDACIGWDQTARQSNLPLVVNHSRFLILPWVRVPNLASHILALAARQMPAIGGPLIALSPCYWKPWWMQHGITVAAIAPPTGSRRVSHRAAGAWIPAARHKACVSTSFCFRSTAVGASGCVPVRIRRRRLHESAGDVG